LSIDRHRLLQDGGIAAEAPLPVAVAEHDDTRAIRRVIFRRERTPGGPGAFPNAVMLPSLFSATKDGRAKSVSGHTTDGPTSSPEGEPIDTSNAYAVVRKISLLARRP
jgi:hypothetical protein